MPSVDLESFKGQKVRICFDISGANATLRSPSNLRDSLIGDSVQPASLENQAKSKSCPSLNSDSVSPRDSPDLDQDLDTYPDSGPTPFTETQSGLTSKQRHSNGSKARRQEEAQAEKVVLIAGLGARGRTEFFQHVVDHLSSLKSSDGRLLLSVLTFDNRGIGGSTIFKKKKDYSSKIMAYDTLALLDYLGWKKVHLVGMSLGGMIACKFAAYWPERLSSFTVISATKSGWHMLAGISRCPVLATLAGGGPLKFKILANLRFNFSDDYLHEFVAGTKRKDTLVENTRKAIEEGDTKKFLAEGQPKKGREGHLVAVATHRMSSKELKKIREAKIPCQLMVGRYDRLARVGYVSHLAKKMKAPLLILDAAHAGIVVEQLASVLANLEATILGNGQTTIEKLQSLSLTTNANVLTNSVYAKEFASSFSPGTLNFSPRPSASKSTGNLQ